LSIEAKAKNKKKQKNKNALVQVTKGSKCSQARGKSSQAIGEGSKGSIIFDLFLINLLIFCNGYPRLETTTIKSKNCTFILATRVLPCFTYWHNFFYVNKNKIIPLDFTIY
jgi:hypothetical protein